MTKISEKAVTETNMDNATIIETCIGSFKRWQLFVFLLVFLVNFPLSMQELSITLLAPPVQFECADPNIPKCGNCSKYEYNTTLFDHTIISEWDLVCDKKWLESFAQTILMAGILVGNFSFGFLADKFGRRKPLVCAISLEVLAGVGVAFAPYLWLFLILRFVVAVAAGGTLVIGFVLVVEIIGRKYRSTFGILFHLPYYIGHASLGAIGYFIRDWRCVQLTISLPVMVLISYYWLLPESPRWLLTVGKLNEAIKVLEKGARFNKMPTEHIRTLITTELRDDIPLKENFLDLFRKPNIRTRTILICLNWIILGLSFFGVAQYMGQIAGNMFLNISIAGLIQIPGNILIIYLVKTVGRKKTMILTYILCSIACLSIIIAPTDPSWIVSILGSISMMGISLSFATMFVWSGELYPTIVRNVGMGTSAMFAKFGSMSAPFLNYAGSYNYWITPLVFGIVPLVGVILCLKLPETLNTKMPDTFEVSKKKIVDNINNPIATT